MHTHVTPLALILAVTFAVSSEARADGTTQSPASVDVAAEVDARIVTDDDFARRVLYSWTTRAQIERLRRDRRLLVATASSGPGPTPFNRSLMALARKKTAHGKIARALLARKTLQRRRYAWTHPYATALPRGKHSYGHFLIKIVLRAKALIGRFEPRAKPPFRFVTASGTPVPLAQVAKTPELIGAIFHIRRPPRVPRAFREYVVCNEALIRSWSVGTKEIAKRVRLEAQLLRKLAVKFRWRARGSIYRTWNRRTSLTKAHLSNRYRATLAFDIGHYLLTPKQLRRVAAALDKYSVAGRPLVTTGPKR